MKRNVIAAATIAVLVASSALAQPTTEADGIKAVPRKGEYSVYLDKNFPQRVFWGVAHVHTSLSFDAGMFGITLTPDDLFRVARGGEVTTDNGMRFKQHRPLRERKGPGSISRKCT